MKIKNDKAFCPLCTAKQLLNKAKISQCTERGYNNSAALTPPMGWSSWNLFRHKISEKLIMEIADAMKQSGLAEAGYTYVNIDDCWQSSTRDSEGRLQCDKVTFPSGIKELCRYVNERGLKLGIYSSNGTLTCEDYPASLRHEAIDADTFAQWGVEYFKYDFCHNVPIPSSAPKICRVSFSHDESGEEFAVFDAKDVTLGGMARIVKDDKTCFGCYIDGLSGNTGWFTVDVNAEKSGEYILTLDIRKVGNHEKFIMVINGEDQYHIYFPGTKSWTPEGRGQIKITLSQGVNTLKFTNPVGSGVDSAAIQYKLMGKELKRATREYAEKTGEKEKPIVFSICEWGLHRPWKWGMEAGNLWRTTPDIKPVWSSVLGIYEATVRLHKYSCPGAWNDPDMLEVGNGELTYEENKSHFSLWCMMNAPLILGNDIRKFILEDGSIDKENKIYSILTNKDMIAVNQDSLGVQARRIKAGLVDVLVKPLKGSKIAVCVLNKTNKEKGTRIDIRELTDLGFVNLIRKDGYKVYDVWEKSCTENSREIFAVAAKHGVKVYIIE